MTTIFSRVSLRDELSSKEDIEWAIYQIIPKIGITLLVGESGTGKTFLAFWLAACIAFGNKFVETTFSRSTLQVPVGQPVKLGATLYIVGEGISGLHLRAQGVEAALQATSNSGLQLPLIIAEADAIGLDGNCTPEIVRQNIELELETLNLCGQDIRLIVIDTVPACFLLDDENHNSKIQSFGNFFKQLSAYFQCPVVALMHPAKNGDKSKPRGAGSIFASADASLFIAKDGKGKKRKVQISKIRDGLCDGHSFSFNLISFGNSAALLPVITNSDVADITHHGASPPDFYKSVLAAALDCISDGITIKANIAKRYLGCALMTGEIITDKNANVRTHRALKALVSEGQLMLDGKHYSLPTPPIQDEVKQTDD